MRLFKGIDDNENYSGSNWSVLISIENKIFIRQAKPTMAEVRWKDFPFVGKTLFLSFNCE